MSKTKSSEIPHYEMLYIVSNQFTEDEVKQVNAKVNALIKDNGGVITYSEDWGKKKLCYQIKQFNHGYFCLVEFDIVGEKLIKISTNLRMSSDVLRFQIVSKHKKTEAEIKAEKVEADKKVEHKIEEVKKKEEEENKKEKEVKKLDLKDLDEKLDKILDTDDLL
jgi:small subunit ribosomal protein S6